MSEFVLAFPNLARTILRKGMKNMLPKDMDVDVHFNPSYAPMRQRLCMTPNGEYFDALKQDNCDVITDEIETVTKDGIKFKSGQELEADMIVLATGLRLQLLSGLTPKVDGKPIRSGEKFAWRGCMLTDLPNMAFIIGYVRTTWTPGSDLMSKIIIRLLQHMERRGADVAVPRIDEEVARTAEKKLAVDLSSNFLLKAADRVPKVTGNGVWYGRENLAKDMMALLFGDMDEGMVFSGPGYDSTKRAKRE
jgi:cation diffusion facilitator CzcD-associated flavoprotein CzcO